MSASAGGGPLIFPGSARAVPSEIGEKLDCQADLAYGVEYQSPDLEALVKVSQLLTTKGRDVVTVRPDDTVETVAKILGERRFGALVVSNDGDSILGIVSERDVVRQLGVDGADLLSKPVSSIMTSTVRVCGEDDTVERLMELMTEHRIRHLPVTSEGKLCGLVSISDVVRVRVRQLEHEADQLERYISNTW